MKRDLELVRKLLFFFDEKPGSQGVEVPPIEGYDKFAIMYHCVLLYDAGYLRCEPVMSNSSARVIKVLPFELTWQGHEFLDKIRSPHIWDEVLSDIQRNGLVSASVDVVKKVADAHIKKHLGLA